MRTHAAFALVLSTLSVFACSIAALPEPPTERGAGELDASTAWPVEGGEAPDAAEVAPETAMAPPAAWRGASVLPVVHAGKRAFVVLDVRGGRDARGADLAEGPPRLVDTDVEGAFAASRAIAIGRLASETRDLVGRRVHLVGERGAACEAVVGEVSLLERVYPDGEAHARWSGTAFDDRGRPLPSLGPDAIAGELWRMTEDNDPHAEHPLVAALRAVSGDCDGAVAATLDPASAPVATPKPASDALASRALRAFRALPEHARVDTDYRTQWVEEVRALERATYERAAGAVGLGGELDELDETREGDRPRAPKLSTTWDTHAEASPKVQQLVVGGATLVWVSASVGEGCGDFAAQLSALFRQSADGALVVVRVFDGFAAELHAAASSRSASGYELFFSDAYAGSQPAAGEVRSLAPRSFGCGC